jgi:hypothetical protein
MAGIRPDVPVIVVLSSWVWAHHLASSFKLHRGPILLLGNFDGTWPGLVSLLNHAATYDRLGIRTRDADGFERDAAFMAPLLRWIATGRIYYPKRHLRSALKQKYEVVRRADFRGNSVEDLRVAVGWDRMC